MAERKPADVSFESWIDRQIREATERGEFDNLPGAGQPLRGLDGPVEELWWLKEHLRREGLDTDALLPTPLLLRKEVGELQETVKGLRSEDEVRELVANLNRRIAEWIRFGDGPRVPLGPVNVDKVVERWRADRTPAATVPVPAAAPPPPGVSWWRRLLGRSAGGSSPR
jgi:hypothetical protein